MTLLARTAQIAARVAERHANVDYVVATDHEEIQRHAMDIGAPVVMTDPELPSGTDRALAAAQAVDATPDFIVNLQGDAPFTDPSHIEALVEAAATSDADVVTPVMQMDWAALDTVRDQKTREPFSGTSCIRHADGRAIWFSKNVIPAIRKEAKLREEQAMSPVWRHLGLYGYRLAALRRFSALPVGHYEALEGLEQLRFLENGMTIDTVAVECGSFAMWGIDTPEDAQVAERIIAEHGDPYHSARGSAD